MSRAIGQVIIARPTIGSNVEEVRNKNVKFQVWDLGGQENLRQAWSTYYNSTHVLTDMLSSQGVIFVVDSADETNSDLAKLEFHSMLLNHVNFTVYSQELDDAAILIFANKQDLPTAKTAEEIAEKFGLPFVTDHEWHIEVNMEYVIQQSCCAITGEGLTRGLDWLTTKIVNKSKQTKSVAKTIIPKPNEVPKDSPEKQTNATKEQADNLEEEEKAPK